MASKTVSLLQKESFFDDPFFADALGDFDLAMQSVLDKFESKGRKVDSTSRSECRDLYRTIRTANIDQDIYASQALQVTEKDGRFNCVMDVKDFNPNQLQVKVVEDRVVVEGKYEKKSEDGSSVSSKSFHKSFTLPSSADLELVSTALSRDGVLTVRAPRKAGSEVVPADGSVKKSSSSVEESSSSVVKAEGGNSSSSMVKQSSVQESSTSSSSVKSSSVVQQSSSVSSSSVKKQSFTSSNSSSFSSTIDASSNIAGALDGSDFDKKFEDMSKAMNDRLVFTHESVNLKLPEN